MTKALQSLLESLKDRCDPAWDVETVELNGRYGSFKETPLHIFAVRGELDACKTLVEAGADLNIPGEYRFTPLHEAISQGHTSVVELFLQNGADPALTTDIGATKFLAQAHPEIGLLLNKYSQ